MTKPSTPPINNIKLQKDRIRFSLGTLAMIAFCTFLIIIATFTQLSFNHYILPLHTMLHPVDTLTETSSILQIKHFEYIPQIPVIVYISALLGPIYGMLSVLLYIALGLAGFPIFALGGGVKYLLQYNFGYIIGYIPAVIVVCKNLKSKFSYKESANASLLAVLIIHLAGISYIIVIALLKREPYQFIFEWITAQSITKFVYDLIFSFLAILLAKFTRKILWLITG